MRVAVRPWSTTLRPQWYEDGGRQGSICWRGLERVKKKVFLLKIF